MMKLGSRRSSSSYPNKQGAYTVISQALKTVLIFGIMSFVTNTAAAQCAAQACDNVSIDGIYVDGNNDNYISTSGTEANLTCTPYGGLYIKVSTSAPKADWLWSSLLSAHHAGSNTRVRTNTSGQCEVVYVYISK